ncbi:MAG: methyl-accepting chemotaxis protein [Aquabacterium sp.]|nr:methyl-accepting chemotaxis protein [Aquabacterium sp.]
MRDIDASSHKITDIIAVIDSLAFQTNILALNAAVEAARAGEQGRGFAVVAAEVRALALRSSQAAAQIKSLISESIDTVRSGTELVGHAGQRIEEIVASVRQVGDVFAHLSADTHEHAGSIGAVTEAVKELDQVTRQNVSVAESTRRIAQSLHEEGLRLEEVLGSFRVGQADGAARSAARPAARTEPAPAAQAAPDAVPQQTVTFF